MISRRTIILIDIKAVTWHDQTEIFTLCTIEYYPRSTGTGDSYPCYQTEIAMFVKNRDNLMCFYALYLDHRL